MAAAELAFILGADVSWLVRFYLQASAEHGLHLCTNLVYARCIGPPQETVSFIIWGKPDFRTVA